MKNTRSASLVACATLFLLAGCETLSRPFTSEAKFGSVGGSLSPRRLPDPDPEDVHLGGLSVRIDSGLASEDAEFIPNFVEALRAASGGRYKSMRDVDKQPQFETILGQGSRMMFAGLIAYGVSQTLNVYIFSRLTAWKGGLLWLRALIASFLSQIVDTLLFITIAFYGVTMEDGTVMPIMGIMEGQIIAKLTLSVIMVPPLIYAFVWLGRRLDRARILGE